MKFARFFGNEFLLGTLVVVLSIMTALASFQGSLSNSEQNKYEILGIKTTNNANGAYVTATQLLIYDFTMYNGRYTAATEEEAAYYESGYSVELQESIAKDFANPFSEEYYTAKYAYAFELIAEAETSFETAGQWDNRSDQLQLVMLLMALGLAFTGWASLLSRESMLRVVFALLAIAALGLGLATYFAVPALG